MQGKKETRFVVYLNNTDPADVALKDRVQVASDTLDVSKSHLIRSAINYALDNVREFAGTVR